MSPAYTRALFRSAAVFNWLAFCLLAPWFGIAPVLGLQGATTGLYDLVALLAIAGFGWGYWLAGTDPHAHKGIILLGAVLKLGVVAIFWTHVLLGNTPWSMAALVSGDLIYAGLFLHALKHLCESPGR